MFTVTNDTYAIVLLRWVNFIKEYELLSHGSMTDS